MEEVIIDYASKNDVLSVKRLLVENLKENLTDENKRDNGFLAYNPNEKVLIQLVNNKEIIIAKEDNHVIGYLVSMNKDFAYKDNFFENFVNHAEKVKYNGRFLKDVNYVIFAQVCIAINYRSKGILRRLYDFAKAEFSKKGFEVAIGEIDSMNFKSMMSHKKIGFDVLSEYSSKEGVNWRIVALKLK
jgi:hypothetical protein